MATLLREHLAAFYFLSRNQMKHPQHCQELHPIGLHHMFNYLLAGDKSLGVENQIKFSS